MRGKEEIGAVAGRENKGRQKIRVLSVIGPDGITPLEGRPGSRAKIGSLAHRFHPSTHNISRRILHLSLFVSVSPRSEVRVMNLRWRKNFRLI